MAQKDAKFVPFSDSGKYGGPVYSGGIIDNADPWAIPYRNTPYARNFRVTGLGVESRPGHWQLGDDFSASGYPFGMAAYYRSDSSNDRIVVRHTVNSTHRLVSVDPSTGAQTPIATAGLITAESRMNFCSANDALYCFNGTDLIGKLSGTTYTNPVATKKPKFGVFFDNSMWVGGDPANPNEFHKSATNDPEDFAGGGSDTFTSPYPVTALAKAGQTLYVFTKNSLDSFNSGSIKQVGSSLVYTALPLESDEGAVCHKSVAVYGNSCYYLSASNKIKRVAPNSSLFYDVEDLSHRPNRGIDATMATLDPDQSESFAYVIPDKGLIMWHVKTKGAPKNDLRIVYSTIYDEFMADTQKVFQDGCHYLGKNFAVSQIEPKIYRDEDGWTDDGSPIQFRYDTKIMNFGAPMADKCVWTWRTFLGLNVLASVRQEIYANGGLIDSKTIDDSTIPQAVAGIGTQPVGTFAVGIEWFSDDDVYDTVVIRDKGYLRARAKTFQAKHYSSALGARVLLQSADAMVEALPFITTSHY